MSYITLLEVGDVGLASVVHNSTRTAVGILRIIVGPTCAEHMGDADESRLL